MEGGTSTNRTELTVRDLSGAFQVGSREGWDVMRWKDRQHPPRSPGWRLQVGQAGCRDVCSDCHCLPSSVVDHPPRELKEFDNLPSCAVPASCFPNFPTSSTRDPVIPTNIPSEASTVGTNTSPTNTYTITATLRHHSHSPHPFARSHDDNSIVSPTILSNFPRNRLTEIAKPPSCQNFRCRDPIRAFAVPKITACQATHTT